MTSYLKRYWLETMVIGAIFGVLLLCNLPGMTWINTDSDGAHYILSAKYMGVAHNTSAPLFLLIGRLFLFLPFGTEAWRMGLISVIATTVCSILIYRVVKYHLRNNAKARWYAMIAAVMYGGSALVITQSTIIETYALSTALSVGAYYACLRRKWLATSVLLGLTLAVHPLFFGMTWLVLFVGYKELRNVKMQAIIFSFVLFYLYIPISKLFSQVPAMWGNSSVYGFFRNNFGTMWMLAGGLSLYDLPKRIINTIGILGISMGLGLIVLFWYHIKQKTLRSSLLWLFVIPVLYFIINLSAETYVYMMPAIAFGSIAVGIGLSKLKKPMVYATAGIAIALLAFNVNYLDIGRTLDPNLSAQTYYDNELPKLNDGDIYLGGGWTWAIVYLYNANEGEHLNPICTDILPSQEYLDMLETTGIKLTRTTSDSFIDKQWAVAQSIAEQNNNVWIAREINPRTLEYELVPAKDNMYLITRWLGEEVTPAIRWQPDNPYDFITGALEVGEWKFILKTNHNARFAIVWGTFGFAFYWMLERMFRRNKNVTHKAKAKDTTAA